MIISNFLCHQMFGKDFILYLGQWVTIYKMEKEIVALLRKSINLFCKFLYPGEEPLSYSLFLML